MTDSLNVVRHHVCRRHALLERLDSAAREPPAGQPLARMGLQVDAAELAKLVELAARLRLTPTLTPRLPLWALEVELGKTA